MHVFKVDAETLGFDDELLKLMLEELCFLRFGGGGTHGDDSSGTRANLEKAGIDETGDDFVSGVGIDFELAGKGAHRGKFVTGAELAGNDGFGGGVDNLLVDGRAGAEVDAEGQHGWRVL